MPYHLDGTECLLPRGCAMCGPWKESIPVILITGEEALARLQDLKYDEARARRILNIAWEHGYDAEPHLFGIIEIHYHGKDDTDQHVFSVIENLNPQRKGVAQPTGKGYTQRKTMPNRSGKATRETTKGNIMPPRKGSRAQAAPPEPQAEANGEVDYEKFLSKPLSAKMTDYVTWFEANVGSLDDIEVDRILVLGTTMYKYFQTSDFNADQTETRRKEREEAAAAQEAPEPAAPARSGRGSRTAKATAAKPATASSGRAGKAPAGRASGRASGRATSAAKSRATEPAGDAPF